MEGGAERKQAEAQIATPVGSAFVSASASIAAIQIPTASGVSRRQSAHAPAWIVEIPAAMKPTAV